MLDSTGLQTLALTQTMITKVRRLCIYVQLPSSKFCVKCFVINYLSFLNQFVKGGIIIPISETSKISFTTLNAL